MTPEATEARLQAIETKVDAIFASIEKTRKYALTTALITVAVIVLPIVGLLFAIPQFLTSYGSIDSRGSLDEQMRLYTELMQ